MLNIKFQHEHEINVSILIILRLMILLIIADDIPIPSGKSHHNWAISCLSCFSMHWLADLLIQWMNHCHCYLLCYNIAIARLFQYSGLSDVFPILAFHAFPLHWLAHLLLQPLPLLLLCHYSILGIIGCYPNPCLLWWWHYRTEDCPEQKEAALMWQPFNWTQISVLFLFSADLSWLDAEVHDRE